MIYHLLTCFICLVLDLLSAVRVAADEKDLEIALLRQQLRILERKAQTKARLSRPEKLMLVVLVDKLRARGQRVHDRVRAGLVLIQPETVLKWHRELVRRKWCFQQPKVGGRPRLDTELGALVVRLARENPRSGYHKIHGELLKMGFVLDPISVRNIMQRHHLPPAPRRGPSSWRTFLKHYRQQMLACDFFTIETVSLKTLYVLFFLRREVASNQLCASNGTPSQHHRLVANPWVRHMVTETC